MTRLAPAALLLALVACKRDPDPAPAPAPSASTSATSLPFGATGAPGRPPLGGQDFPDGVLALTWDDGPDDNTLPIATMLAQMKIVATFFVVGEWIDGQSEEPGESEKVVFGKRRTSRILKDLVALDQRVANHTQHHALLTKPGVDVRRELDENQRALDPFQSSELALFRPPGGAWNDATSHALDTDPTLRRLVGPVHWDIDRKDWEGSLYCRSENPGADCEPLPLRGGASDRKRVKASVIAKRYLDAIEARKHGVVLLHDRVGHVGSTYALDVARGLLPVLIKGDWVFVAPVLRFSEPALRLDDRGTVSSSLTIVGGEVCDATQCARPTIGGSPLHLVLQPWTPSKAPPPKPNVVSDAMRAALSVAAPETIRAGDINGDGRLDACGASARGVVCSLAKPSGAFTAATVWMSDPFDARRWAARDRNAYALGDINGDKRADLCIRDPEGIRCALAP